MSRRKSVYSYNFSVDMDTSNVIEAPISQMGTSTESQSTQDDTPPSVPEELSHVKLPKADASSRQNVPLEEEHMPVNRPFTERPNNEPEISSHHLEGGTTKVLGSAPGRNASVLHGEDDNIGYQAMLGGDMLVQDEPIHPPEIPPDAHNQSHIQDEDVEKQAVDISHELPLSKDGRQNAVPKEKQEAVSKERKTNFSLALKLVFYTDKPIHTSEIPPEDTVPQNQSHIHEGNFEKPAVGTSNELSLSKDNKQKRVRNDESKKQPLKRMKRGAEETSNPLGIPLKNCDTETQIRMQDTNIEQTVDTRAPWSPNKGRLQKEGQRRKKRQEGIEGTAWQHLVLHGNLA
ncbi:hypothetical protein ZWY2020_010915 [Hordeum vulgare]|nr:hypothetical protein ZWY2020_010915 [Hordeum vulgare]